jgi:hypothetical protein
MKWVGCFNHNLQNEKVRNREILLLPYNYNHAIRLASHHHNHKPQYEGLKHYIEWSRPAKSKKWVGCLIIYRIIKVILLLPPLRLWEQIYISGWGCIHMTAIRNRRCGNTIYMYEADLLWVWSVCGCRNHILHHMLQVRNRVNHLLPLWLCAQAYSSWGWGCILMTTSHCRRCWNTICM